MKQGKTCSHVIAEFGEHIHCKHPKKSKMQVQTLEGKWGECCSLEAIGEPGRRSPEAWMGPEEQQQSAGLATTEEGARMDSRAFEACHRVIP